MQIVEHQEHGRQQDGNRQHLRQQDTFPEPEPVFCNAVGRGNGQHHTDQRCADGDHQGVAEGAEHIEIAVVQLCRIGFRV